MLSKVRNLLARSPAPEPGVISREDVVAAFRAMLGREPESERAIAFHRTHASLGALYAALAESAEYRQRTRVPASPSFHQRIDAAAIIRRYEDPARQPRPGHVVNFQGVAINTRFAPEYERWSGLVTEVPIPCNFHADMAEWGAALRAVDLAPSSFAMIELGCGWGCWMTATAFAARRRGLPLHVTGVEGDPGHCDMAREAFATNGIAPSEYTLYQGVAAAKAGTALFPKPDPEGRDWGYEPIFDSASPEYARALGSGRYDPIRIVPLSDVIGDRPRIDLLHMDIQGGEADLVRDCLDLLGEKVAYLVIGTHSRPVEGRLFETLLGAGWVLEIEQPAEIDLHPQRPATRRDGVQGWRNARLAKG